MRYSPLCYFLFTQRLCTKFISLLDTFKKETTLLRITKRDRFCPKDLEISCHYRFCRQQRWFRERAVAFFRKVLSAPLPLVMQINPGRGISKSSTVCIFIVSLACVYKAQSYILRNRNTRIESKSTIFDFKLFYSPYCPKYCRRAIKIRFQRISRSSWRSDNQHCT